MQITQGVTTFSQISQQLKTGGQFHGVPGEKHLRLSPAGDLHTHRTDKRSGVHFLDRAEKHKQAALAIKQAIDTQVGMAGVGDRVFERLGLDNKVKLSDMDAIRLEISRAQTDVSRQQVLDKARPLSGEYQTVKTRYFQQISQLPNVAGTDHPLASDNTGLDYMRANIDDADKGAALDKLALEGSGSLSRREAAGVIRAMFYEPVADNRKLARLINNDALPDAVGYYSGHNTLQATVIGKNDVTRQDSTTAALRLKAVIDRTLTPGEKAALGERIDFVVEQARANVAKLGIASTRPEDANDQDKMWMKSIAVSFPTFLGTDESVLEAIGGQGSEARIKSRDFVTALAIHRDTIFG